MQLAYQGFFHRGVIAYVHPAFLSYFWKKNNRLDFDNSFTDFIALRLHKNSSSGFKPKPSAYLALTQQVRQ